MLGFACQAPHPIIQIDDALRGMKARTVLVAEGLTLYSPYDVELSRQLLVICLDELDLTQRIIGSAPSRTIPFVMIPGESLPGFPSDSGIFHEGLAGSASPEGFASVHVPSPGGPLAATITTSCRSRVRHELAHVCFYALDVPRPRWFSEAVATEVELALTDENGTWRVHPVPDSLLSVLSRATPPTVDELLDWSGKRGDPRDERRLYDAAWSFFRYFNLSSSAAGSTDVPLHAAIEHIATLDAEILKALQPGWQHWLENFDVVAALTQLADEQGGSRRKASSLLTIGGELGVPQLQDASADEFAQSMLLTDDVWISTRGEIFLVLYRGPQVGSEFVDSLLANGDPRCSLTALAIRKRSGETIDEAAALAALSRVSSAWRAQSMSVSVLGFDRN